jgi:acyl carrier protein
MTVEDVVARTFGLPRRAVSDATSNENTDAWDSMGHMTLVAELETAFGGSFSAEEVLTMTSVAAIKKALGHRGGA